jgi:glucose-1-phosphate thymidylyltransferase
MQLRGLILSGGSGTRLRPLTYTSAKQLVPVANKPVLFFGIEAMVAAGIEDITIIISPQTGDEIRAVAGDGSRWGIRLHYVVQDKPAGLAHAVLTAEASLGANPFAMYLGDNLLRDGIEAFSERFRSGGADSLILLQHVPNPSSYGVAELEDGRVVRLTEKPAEPKSDLALVGVYMFQPSIFDACRAIKPSPRGELEITDAIQWLIDSGKVVEPHVVTGWWKDTGQWADMMEANRLVLDAVDRHIEGDILESDVEGRVVVSRGARIERCRIRGPVVIGEGAVVRDAYIGPYTAIGPNCHVDHCEVENSILLEGALVADLDTRLEGSLIGRNVRVRRSHSKPKAYRLLVGDNSEIKIP